MQCQVTIGHVVDAGSLATCVGDLAKDSWSESEFRQIFRPTNFRGLSASLEKGGMLPWPFCIAEAGPCAALFLIGGRNSLPTFLESLDGGLAFPVTERALTLHFGREQRMLGKNRSVVQCTTSACAEALKVPSHKAINLLGSFVSAGGGRTYWGVTFRKLAMELRTWFGKIADFEKGVAELRNDAFLNALAAPRAHRTVSQQIALADSDAYLRRIGLAHRRR